MTGKTDRASERENHGSGGCKPLTLSTHLKAMFKKGDPGDYNNRKPVTTEPPIEEIVPPWRGKRSSSIKQFGVEERWLDWKGKTLRWTMWYRTERDRDQALKALRKKQRHREITYTPVER